MGFTSIWHWIIVLVVVLVLFGGRGKISALMGDFGRGLKNFKKGVGSDEDNQPPSDSTVIENQEDAKSDSKTKKKRNKEN
ncbi:MAG: twin-arginine translocase TatA/TatE family subunit [Pseudomonadota bacterium]|nr:twin-arginine translocase TatA/TatE family subunit [Pseudomonadota bacterium]